MIDKRPALIVRCAGVADVIRAVQFARTHNLLVAVRGGGHNVAGNAVCTGGLMIDLVPIIQLTVGVIAHAQQTGKVFRIGFLDASTASGMAGLLEVFRQELTKLGWIEGKNVAIEYRFANGKLERLPELASDLIRLKVDLIVVAGTPTALAAKNATTTIPIVVMINAGDPVGAGLVASLARPGGNVTGFAGLVSELNTKRLEILKDAVPRLTRVAIMRQPGPATQWKEIRPAALALKLKLEEIETQPDAKGIESAFSNRKAEAGGRDYNEHWSPLFRGKKANRRACY